MGVMCIRIFVYIQIFKPLLLGFYPETTPKHENKTNNLNKVKREKVRLT